MNPSWTFGQKLAASFAAAVALTIVIGVVGIYALRAVVERKDEVLRVQAQNLADAQSLSAQGARKVVAFRGFLLGREPQHIAQMNEARAAFAGVLARLRARVEEPEGRRLLDAIEQAEGAHQTAAERLIALRRTDASLEAVSRAFNEDLVARADARAAAIDAFSRHGERALRAAREAATRMATQATMVIVLVTLGTLLLATVLAVALTRTLTRQIGSAVQHVQSSSAELQATASQQAVGTRQQATAMTEITTTINELLATSRQIAESAQRVAHIAEETAAAARAGDQTMLKAQDSVAGIRRQVDLIVGHMLDLGRKSQQIGGILEIINELAEQTNILSINATIEAAGAGEAGRRFAVVADEIRKLADRVGGSTKEIRALIDEVRAAVNTTVMVTEAGSKAVDGGTRQFAEVVASLKHIAGLVTTTTEAAREIELSTKQQASAVEQVNVAIANVAQATRESEVGSNQTLETASQLSQLSKDLTRLIQPSERA